MARIALLYAAAMLLVAIVVVALAYCRFDAAMRESVVRLLAGAAPAGAILTEDMLGSLPPPAQRYFRHAGVVGTALPAIVRLRQHGRIRSASTSAWMNLEADETYSTDPPAFVWRAYFPRRLLPVVIGRDEYLEGEGSILMKLAALYPVAHERGEALRAAGLMRYLNEMAWFPAAYLGSNIAIAPVDDNSFTVTIRDRGMTVTGTLFIDPAGGLVNFRAQRFNTATQAMETWETPMSRHGERAGIQVPVAGKAVWKLKDGDFDYIELEIDDVTYAPSP
jgi:hypothetical protein